MKGEFTAIIERAPEGGYWAICPEIPGANGQGETVEEAKQSLRQAVLLILEDRLEDGDIGDALNLLTYAPGDVVKFMNFDSKFINLTTSPMNSASPVSIS